ncbi:hypothetical protein BCS96_10270 [Vibrio breoganii]|uniref:glycosyltransferase family 2 protein n=1 Tax=Vibrio breoganii TaxID=553239 RepID=UPI000C81DD9F|nr:glycosyltransferase family 2 protein [Vibrio breoganii]PMO99176.1 hypothetical protein BCS96_10270 [Vibrio breoganii]
MQPLISVLIPVYNVAEFINEAIESIVNQTYRNIEVIIVDDCSTDNTFSICNMFAKMDKRVSLYRNEENVRISKTLNYGLSKCNGEYILRMDGDDIASVDRIETLLNYLENNNLDLVSSFNISIDESGRFLGENYFPVEHGEMSSFSNYISVCSHNWLARKTVYDQLGGYRNIPSVEDFDFLQRALIHGLRIGNVPYWGMKIRVRSNNTLSTFGLKQRLSFIYVRRINSDRSKFCEEELNAYIQKYSFMSHIHLKSDLLLRKYINGKNKFRFVWLLLSCMLSPFQLLKVINRIIYRYKLDEVKKRKYVVLPFKGAQDEK